MFQNLPLFSKNHQTKTVTTGLSLFYISQENRSREFKWI